MSWYYRAGVCVCSSILSRARCIIGRVLSLSAYSTLYTLFKLHFFWNHCFLGHKFNWPKLLLPPPPLLLRHFRTIGLFTSLVEANCRALRSIYLSLRSDCGRTHIWNSFTRSVIRRRGVHHHQLFFIIISNWANIIYFWTKKKLSLAYSISSLSRLWN